MSRPRPTSVPAFAKKTSTRPSSSTAVSTRRGDAGLGGAVADDGHGSQPVGDLLDGGVEVGEDQPEPLGREAGGDAPGRCPPAGAGHDGRCEPDAYTSDAARHGEAAVEDEGLAGDPGGVVGEQVGDGAGRRPRARRGA